MITSGWGMSDNHPRAEFYRLTAAGRRWLDEAMARALAASPGGGHMIGGLVACAHSLWRGGRAADALQR